MTRRPAARGTRAAPVAQDWEWSELVGKIGVGIAEPLTDALEHVHSLVSGGRVDKARLRKLRAALEEARQIGMTAQQLNRLAARRVRISHENVRLDTLLRDLLRHRAREAQSRGLRLPDPNSAGIREAEVLIDATLLHSLLSTLFDWLLRHAEDALQFNVEIKNWPQHARLRCSFNALNWQTIAGDDVPAMFTSLSWHLLEQIAGTLDLVVSRRIDGPAVEVAMEFPRTGKPGMPGIGSIDLGDQSTWEPDSVPLVGRHVLIVASRRALRLQIRNAVTHLGLTIDLVSSVDEATEFCRGGLPHAMVVERILEGEQMSLLRSELLVQSPKLAFIVITEEGEQFEMSDDTADQVALVRRSALETALPAVLLFELSRGQ